MTDIQLIDVDPITRRIVFVLKAKTLSGISKLVQIVVISLLTSPGKDVLDPERGGGILDLLGSNIDPNDSTELFAEVVQKIKKTEKEVIQSQIGLNDPSDERLREVQIVDLSKGANADELFIRLRIINEASESIEVVA